MSFPYQQYMLVEQPLKVYHPAGQEQLARWLVQTIEKAGQLLSRTLEQKAPDVQVLLVDVADWDKAPRDEEETVVTPYPYLTEVTEPSSIVIPTEIDQLYGQPSQEKLAFIVYHALALAFLENDPRPWPENYPLWADEWQLTFVALWLSQQLDDQEGIINKDLREQYAEIFEPEADGKTPVTIRGFDWYEDTSPEEYLVFELLLEQFAADLLSHWNIDILPRYLSLYRKPNAVFLSDDITAILADALGPGGLQWLEDLVYF